MIYCHLYRKTAKTQIRSRRTRSNWRRNRNRSVYFLHHSWVTSDHTHTPTNEHTADHHVSSSSSVPPPHPHHPLTSLQISPLLVTRPSCPGLVHCVTLCVSLSGQRQHDPAREEGKNWNATSPTQTDWRGLQSTTYCRLLHVTLSPLWSQSFWHLLSF